MSAITNPFTCLLRGSAILALALSPFAAAQDGATKDAISIVFTLNGVSKSIPIDNLGLQADKFTVKTPAEGLPTIPLNLEWASHVSGAEPQQISEAVGLILMNKPSDALALLDPIMESHKITAKVPGNYWIRAARAALVAHSINRATSRCAEIGKEISDATPTAGDDPSVSLSNVMLTPLSVSINERIKAYEGIANDASPPEVSAYASYFRGNLLKTAKRNSEALEAYLTIPAVYPTCGRVIMAAAAMNAGELVASMNRRDEAILYLEDAKREGKGTVIGAEAEKRIPLVK
jgi:hypothetical protein